MNVRPVPGLRDTEVTLGVQSLVCLGQHRHCCHSGTHIILQDPCDTHGITSLRMGLCPREDPAPSLQGDCSPRDALCFPHPGGFSVTGTAPAKAAGQEHQGFVLGSGL